MEYTKETEEYTKEEEFEEEEFEEEEFEEEEEEELERGYSSYIPILGISVVIAMEIAFLYFSLGSCVSEEPRHLDL